MPRTVMATATLIALTAACGSDAPGDDGTRGGSREAGSSGEAQEDPFARDASVEETRPPVVSGVAPLSGDYGTEVTITGEGFDRAGTTLVLDAPAKPIVFTKPSATAPAKPSDPILAWSDTSITIKYPFPAEGALRVTNPAGSAEGPAFEPSVTPGVPLAGTFTRRELLAAVSPAANAFVLAFDGDTGPKLVYVDVATGALSEKPLPRSAILRNLSLYVDASGVVGGFYEQGGNLVHLTDVLGTPTATATTVGAQQVAGGADATGPYAWIRNAGSEIARVRPPGFTAETTVTDPTPSSAPGPSMAVAPDHSLFVGWGVNDTGSFPLYDYTAFPRVRRLRPGQTTFDAAKQVGGGADDYMIWTRFRPGPEGRVASYFCATDTGLLSSPALDCGEGYTGSATPTPSATLVSEYMVGWNDAAGFAAACRKETATLHVGPEGQTASQSAWLFPCPRIVAVAADAAGTPLLLVDWEGNLYAPRPR